jgi:hypothetical protein
MTDFPAPAWVPAVVPRLEWTVEHTHKYLHGKGFTIFENGTCVVWPTSENLGDAVCSEKLLSVVKHHPDFKVRRHSSGDFLVMFRGGVGGIMPREMIEKCLPSLRAEAYSQGKLPSEILRQNGGGSADDTDVIAGLYVRARLYRDAVSRVVVYRTAESS